MKKLLLLSVILASIAIPVRAARIKNPKVGLKRSLVQVALFNLFYIFALFFIWGRL